MNVGGILPDELEEIQRLHAESGFDYRLPNFPENPEYPIQLSVRHQGQLMAAVVGKLECEIYLWINHECGSPKDRFEGLAILNRDLARYARRLGFSQLYCVLPPEIEKSFGPRLEEHGWKKDRGWSKYTCDLV